MSFFLGVDGGGTKTTAVLVDDAGVERGRGDAGSGNQSGVGFDAAVANIYAAVTMAAAQANTTPPFARAWVGLAGVDRPADIARFLLPLRELSAAARVTNDAELLLSALDGAIGVALIAGTGSISFGLDPHGTRARAGGWGWRIGDEGSGYLLGIGALRAATQAADGRGPQTALLASILTAWHLAQPSDLIGAVYSGGGIPNGEIAALSSRVFCVARAGDAVARILVRQGAADLARIALATADTLDFGDQPLPLAFAGGLLLHEQDYRATVLRCIRRRRAVGQIAIVHDPAFSAAQAMCVVGSRQ